LVESFPEICEVISAPKFAGKKQDKKDEEAVAWADGQEIKYDEEVDEERDEAGQGGEEGVEADQLWSKFCKSVWLYFMGKTQI
jgi:hypothetical protein